MTGEKRHMRLKRYRGVEQFSTDVAFAVSTAVGRTFYGTPEPRLEFSFPVGTSSHIVNACLYALASELEVRTTDEDPWKVVVCLEAENVHLELVHADQSLEVVVDKAMLFLETCLGEVCS